MRIKLPGSPKVKMWILAVLVVISVCIIGKTAIDNKKEQELKIEQKQEEDRQEQIKKEEEEQTKIQEEKSKREQELYDNAYNLFHNKQYKEAIDAANNLLEEFSESYKGYSIKGIAEGYLGDFENGMKDIDKSLEINSEYAYGRFNKALLYELNGSFDNALLWYDKALELEKYMWSYYGKASIYGRKGAASKAVSNLKLAIESAPSEADKKSLKESARNEEDFDPVNGDKEFQNVINN